MMYRLPAQSLSGPTEGAAPLLVALGLVGGAALIGYLIWPKKSYTPNYNMRWSGLRQFLRESKARDKAISAERDEQLRTLSTKCKAQKQQITDQCRLERGRLRQDARTRKVEERARRADAWDNYRWHAKYGKPRKTSLSRTESDSLAEHSVEPHLLPLWRKHRAQFSYKLPPDERVELFMEWVHENREEAEAEFAEMMTPTDAELAAAARAHYEAEEAVPF